MPHTPHNWLRGPAASLPCESAPARRRPVGNPNRLCGVSKIVERRYVNRAYAELTALALSHSRPDWARELFVPGSRNSLSRGRRLVAWKAWELAARDHVTLDPREIPKQIREYVKTTPPPSFNALRPRKKEREPARKKIPAAGM